jgi:transcriptional regulator with XRE-family HTH domain
MTVHPIDILIGSRIRDRRKQLRLTLQELGDQLHMTPKKIHKIELGQCRLGCSGLYEIAIALRLADEIGWFFGMRPKAEAKPRKRKGNEQ